LIDFYKEPFFYIKKSLSASKRAGPINPVPTIAAFNYLRLGLRLWVNVYLKDQIRPIFDSKMSFWETRIETPINFLIKKFNHRQNYPEIKFALKIGD